VRLAKDNVSGHDIIRCLPWMSTHGNPMIAPAYLMASPCTPLKFTFSPVKLMTCSRLLVKPRSLPVLATAPDMTHDAVDGERASGGKIMVVQSAGTTWISSGKQCEDKMQQTRDAKQFSSISLKCPFSVMCSVMKACA